MIKNNKSIAILMSTYNGEAFISQQIDSILNQTYKDWNLYIRDDLSTDKTVEIIKHYIAKDNRIVLLDSSNRNLGSKDSFLSLLETIDSELYMFTDQDDVWLPNKVQLAIENYIQYIGPNDTTTPFLYYTNVIPVDVNLNSTESLWKLYNLHPELYNNWEYALINPVALGMTMLFNKALRNRSLPADKNAGMHDSWIFYIASKYGNLIADSTSTVLYRQHGNNVCGATSKENLQLGYYIKNLKNNIHSNYLRYKRLNKIDRLPALKYIRIKLIILYNRYFKVNKYPG